jgi:putative SOS response-associated peptidase YedK
LTSHYKLDCASPEIAAHFGADAGPDPWGGGDILPGQFAPVIAMGRRKVIRPMHWGYPPPGQSTEALGPNAPRWVAQVRNPDSPFWIGNLRHVSLRCLVPATGFALRFSKAEHWYGVADTPLFAFAGIWRDLTDMPVFAILTTGADDALLPVEGGKGPAATPLVLRADQYDRWLSADWKDAQKLVQPFPARYLVER